MRARPDTARANKAAETLDGFVCLCVIGPPHGVRGAVKAKCFTDDPQALTAYGALQDAGGRAFEVISVNADKMGARLTIKGVNDRAGAKALRGTALYVAREKLPLLEDEDDFYHDDLIGLEVVSDSGASLGAVTGVYNFGAGDLLEVTKDKKNAFYPFTKAVVPEINIAAGQLVLLPPKEDEARPPEQMAEQEAENQPQNKADEK